MEIKAIAGHAHMHERHRPASSTEAGELGKSRGAILGKRAARQPGAGERASFLGQGFASLSSLPAQILAPPLSKDLYVGFPLAS